MTPDEPATSEYGRRLVLEGLEAYQRREGSEALDLLERGRAILGEAGDLEGVAIALKALRPLYEDLANFSRTHGHLAEAMKAYRRAVTICGELGDAGREQQLLAIVSELEAATPEAEQAGGRPVSDGSAPATGEAVEGLQGVLAEAREADDRTREGLALAALGVTYRLAGQPAPAREASTLALPILREVEDHVSEVETLNNLGAIDLDVGDVEGALGHWAEAQRVARENGYTRGHAAALSNLGALYTRLGQFAKTVEYCEQALTVAGADEPAEAARIHHNLGVALWKLDRTHAALGHLHAALAKAEEAARASPGMAIDAVRAGIAATLGALQHGTGFLDEAIGRLEDALTAQRQLGDRRGEARTLLNLGAAQAKRGHPGAIGTLMAATAICREVGDPPTEIQAWALTGRLLRAGGALDEAASHLDYALELIEDVRGGILTEELRTGYFSTVADIYASYAGVLIDQRNPAAALRAAERGKARSFLELLDESKARIRAGVDPAVLAEERRLLGELSSTGRRLVEERAKPEPDGDAIAELEDRVRDEELSLAAVQTQIRRETAGKARVDPDAVWGVDEIQTRLLDEETALLEYVLGEEDGHLIVVLSDDLAVFPLPPRGDIENKVRALREAVIPPTPGVPRHAHDLYTDLIAREADGVRAVDLIEGKRLLVVPDGILHYLPFELLLTEDPRPDQDHDTLPYLARSYTVAYAPSATVAGHLAAMERVEDWGKDFLAFADPLLGGDASPERSVALGAAIAHTGAVLGSLPATRGEVTHIASMFEPDTHLDAVEAGGDDRHDGERVALRLRGEASKDAAVRTFDPQTEPSPTRFVHFSTHGLLDEERPQFSGLVFSPGGDRDPYWQTFEIFNARIPADLVVLSACETGLGKLVGGEGVVGLSRAFFYAGARAVVVSLWRVPDSPTAAFMESFYAELLGNEHSRWPADALALAKRRLVDVGTHPYFWAGFVLAGAGWPGPARSEDDLE